MARRPWSSIPILDGREPLLPLPSPLHRLEPHPYASLGAPYGPEACPFRLRQGVVARLLRAQRLLHDHEPGWRLAIFDAWRPVAVQRFMVAHAVAQTCRERGLDPEGAGPAWEEVREEVAAFWAPPSEDPATPPPHSTGGAVDLTLAGANGEPLDMGGAIDAIGPVSHPHHHAAAAAADPASEAARWHRRRRLLADVMIAAGFAQHPGEWWHFSWGDQLWAWRTGHPLAVYGRVGDEAAAGVTVGELEGGDSWSSVAREEA
ncbi:MAG: M15 family metallopeptidase [Cyanobacteria bacterium K_Offshore_surface_m2_239]|nr:M15 family metallopeptidase [Cyanobacteria bacterium K_Offshore_surface_m2_239]